MLSAQVDELRELATRYDELQVGAVKAVTMPSNMGSILREAADTIWQLRDDLQRTHGLLDDAEHDESRAWDRARKAEADNAKLRELSGFMLRCMKRNHDCDCCLVNGEHCEISYIESDARELGIEVD